MAKKRKYTRITRSDRGVRGFIKNNANLIQNVAFEKGTKENGFIEKVPVYVNPLSEKHGNVMRDRDCVMHKVSPELVAETKKKQKIFGTQAGWKVNESPLRKFWGVLYRFDQLHGTQLQNAMKVWMMQNPAVKELRTRKRLPVMVEVACKMAAATGVVSTTATRGAFVSEGVV